MPHQSDGALLTEVEEWITGKEALLYIQLAFDLALDMNTLFMLGGKFGLIKKIGDTLLFDSRGVHHVVNKCYFPTIPKGWMSVAALSKKYPYAREDLIRQWVQNKKVNIKKIEIGVEDVTFVEEASFLKRYKESLAQKRLHDQPGNEWRKIRRTDGGRGKQKWHREKGGKRYKSNAKAKPKRKRKRVDRNG